MKTKIYNAICSLEFYLALIALLHIDLGVWSLFIEGENLQLAPTSNNIILLLTIAYTLLALIHRKLLRLKLTWIVYLGFSIVCLVSSLPYSSNLYFLWVYIDIFLVVLFFTTPSNQKKATLISLSSRILICTIFGAALIQKLITPAFMDGGFYYHAFSSGRLGFQFSPFAERFLFQDGLSDYATGSNIKVFTSMSPELTIGSIISVPIYQSNFLLNVSGLMVWLTVFIEGACLVLFGFNTSRKFEYVNHIVLFCFLIGTYAIVPIIYDWGLTFATLGMTTASDRWKPFYLLIMMLILIFAVALAPRTVELTGQYQRLLNN